MQQSSLRSWMSPSRHWLSLVLGLVVVVLLAAACVPAPAATPAAALLLRQPLPLLWPLR